MKSFVARLTLVLFVLMAIPTLGFADSNSLPKMKPIPQDNVVQITVPFLTPNQNSVVINYPGSSSSGGSAIYYALNITDYNGPYLVPLSNGGNAITVPYSGTYIVSAFVPVYSNDDQWASFTLTLATSNATTPQTYSQNDGTWGGAGDNGAGGPYLNHLSTTMNLSAGDTVYLLMRQTGSGHGEQYGLYVAQGFLSVTKIS